MLRVEDLRAGYGRTGVLNGVSLSVADGEVVAILGRNGVGKSTLLKAIIGAIPVTNGRILLGDRDLTRARSHLRARSGIAYVPQGRDVFPRLTVLDNLRVAAYGSRHRGWANALEQLLDEFPILREKSSQMGASLSGGQQQILALARALMTNPKVLLLDEPSEGIQPTIVEQIAETITQINSQRGTAVVLVEQNLDFATKVAGKAFLMDKGEVVRESAVEAIADDRTVQREYLGV